MSTRPGCLRPFLFGCLGIVALGLLLVLVAFVMAWRGVQRSEVVDSVVTTADTAGVPALTARAPGRVILELGQGEFYVRAARPGEGVRVEARFDRATHALTDSLEVLADGSWVYRVTYGNSVPMLQSLFQSLLGGSSESRVRVWLPPDLPIALEVRAEQGGAEIDLGGLWLTEADLDFSMGGVELEFSSPLREPLGALELRASMGGMEVVQLGNASPRRFDTRFRMGGLAVDLSGAWAGDCEARFDVTMGGVALSAPPGLAVRPFTERDGSLAPGAGEVPQPTFWYRADVSMGELEIDAP